MPPSITRKPVGRGGGKGERGRGEREGEREGGRGRGKEGGREGGKEVRGCDRG